jgi:DNA invertase Pin-like site-specific DNA recombinase
MKVAIYARVSMEDQHCEIQLRDLRRHAQAFDWEVVEFVEKASGKEGSARPVMARLLGEARQHNFDAVLCWKMDRFGRSVLDFINNARELANSHVRLLIPSQGIDTSDESPFGKFLVRMLSLLAELERDLIWERTTRGQVEYTRAFKAGEVGKERHSKSGKDLPVGNPRRIFDRTKALEMSKKGASIREIAKAVGVGKSIIDRLLKGKKRRKKPVP